MYARGVTTDAAEVFRDAARKALVTARDGAIALRRPGRATPPEQDRRNVAASPCRNATARRRPRARHPEETGEIHAGPLSATEFSYLADGDVRQNVFLPHCC
jgi:hypothetical protein